MIKILFDHQKFTTQRFGGISRYFAALMERLQATESFDYEIGLEYSENEYLNIEFSEFKKLLFSNKIGKRFLYQLNERKSLEYVKKDNFDIFHPTYYDNYFAKDLKKPLVTTIHDMTYELLPEYFWAQDPLTQQKRMHIEQADAIIAISESTKNDILNVYPSANENRIHVIHHGIELVAEPETQIIPTLPETFVLFVGDRSGYKNFYKTLTSYKIISGNFPELKLVLVGGGSLAIAENEAINRLGLKDKVVHMSLNNAQLNYTYQKAQYLIYPSLYEGFGLPILEAFQNNCPLILSHIPCFKEIAGSAALYFEPNEEGGMIKPMELLLTDENLKRHLIALGREKLKQYDIKTCLEKTLNLYESLV
ncbi:glycosyltransferase family 4 protein [Marinilongibacter aquaticus]|uniref:glycosyltransferase family 4 protein n=1 Tax=Marinilongibacter aquaticus TaxID=2975157 RepID=UPI0021BD1CAA|nr:glycosyltransferase family 1 protein [Marinilongibacter aquaticus]UBM60727.1 glycosyltransferase family 4 protein [Marinilongibacter aquaticus]